MILVVDDEKAMTDGLKYNLELEGYRVEVAGDGQAALDLVHAKEVSLMLLDIMMPGMNGLKVLEILREEGNRTPVILLTAKSQPEDKVTGLEIGADDYVTKPFGVTELMARIRAVLRRTKPDEEPPAEVFSFDDLTIDFRRFLVVKDGKEYPLSRFESEILRYLVAHRDEVVTRRDLLTKVWGYVNLPTTRTVDNHIARLRKKVEKIADDPKYIMTVHGIGYRFLTGKESSAP
ncbi:MAG: response regulator transcription factor [Planctomycetota bacterium]